MTVVAEPAARTAPPASSEPTPPRRPGSDAEYVRKAAARTDALMRWLLPLEWMLTLFAAATLATRLTHPVLVSLGAGAAFTLPALLVMRRSWPRGVTQATAAWGQVGFSLLFINLADGHAEAHAVLFGALALLALYRDWRLLLATTAAIVVIEAAFAHWAPALLFGDTPTTVATALQHGGWLFPVTAILSWLGLRWRGDVREICQAQEQQQELLADVERRLRERVRTLEAQVAECDRTASTLRQSEAHQRELIFRLPIGVFESTRSGRVKFANAHALSLVGLPAHIDASAVSMVDGRIFPTESRERLWTRLENEGEVRAFHATLHHFDGSTFDVVINARVKSKTGGELAAEGTIEDVTARKRAERELEALHSQLMLASRQAGMAEVANGVLHNVGNVLTSVNLIVHDVQDRLKTTRLSHLRRVVEILQREQHHLGEYLTQDPTGRQVPEFLTKLDEFLVQENQQLIKDVDGLVRHFEHIREIIVTQQGSSQMCGVLEMLDPAQLFEDSLRLDANSRERQGITLERAFDRVGRIRADRHKVLQILVNLLKNARDALQVRPAGERLIRVRIAAGSPGHVTLAVQDNGAGILTENLTRVFQHGYTTKRTGHGFGLHSSVLAAQDMGGDLSAASDGLGLGATFTLRLPAAVEP